MDITYVSAKPYAETLQSVIDETESAKFRVLTVHDVQATLAEKGFERSPYAIVELCNSKHAHAVLAAEPKIGLMLPCPIAVYVQDGKVLVATMRPTMIAAFFPDADVADTAAEVERVIVGIMERAVA